MGQQSDASRQSIVMIKGHPGCGKSHTARALAKKLRWPVIDKDDARGPLHTAGFEGAADNALNETSYEIMFRVVETQLSCGMSVIIDCPFARVSLFKTAKRLADKVCGSTPSNPIVGR